MLKDLFKTPTDEAWDPFDNSSDQNDLSDPNLDTGHYDDGHSFGWKKPGETAKPAIDLAKQALTKPEHSVVDDLFKAVEIPKTPPPPTEKLYTYAFSGLQLAFDGPLNPVLMTRPHVVETFTGAGCGTATSANFKGTIDVQSFSPLNLAWAAALTTGKSKLVYTYNFKDQSGALLGEVDTSLIFLAGTTPQIGLRWSKQNDIPSVTTSPDTALAVTPVTSCS